VIAARKKSLTENHPYYHSKVWDTPIVQFMMPTICVESNIIRVIFLTAVNPDVLNSTTSCQFSINSQIVDCKPADGILWFDINDEMHAE